MLRGFVAFHREATPQTPATVLLLNFILSIVFCFVKFECFETEFQQGQILRKLKQWCLNLYFTIFLSFSRVESLPAKSRNTLSCLVLVVQLNFRSFFSHPTKLLNRAKTPPTFHLPRVFLPFNPGANNGPKTQKRWEALDRGKLKALSYAIDRGKLKAVLALAEEWRGWLVGDWMIWRFSGLFDVLDFHFGEILQEVLCVMDWLMDWWIDGLIDWLFVWLINWLIEWLFWFVLFRSMLFCVPPSIRSCFQINNWIRLCQGQDTFCRLDLRNLHDWTLGSMFQRNVYHVSTPSDYLND